MLTTIDDFVLVAESGDGLSLGMFRARFTSAAPLPIARSPDRDGIAVLQSDVDKRQFRSARFLDLFSSGLLIQKSSPRL
jgi:hypothetical protein